MATFDFANNARTTLASAIGPTDTVIAVATGTGDLFPSPGAGEQFTLTFNDSETGLIDEIAYCTSRTGDSLTVTRGEEGTAALSWNVGDLASNYLTAGTMRNMVQSGGVGPDTPFAPGMYAEFAMTSVALPWVLCDGTGYSSTTEALLFAEIGYTYGGSAGTFHVPDFLTDSAFARANGAAAAALGTLQQDQEQGHVHYGGVGVTTGSPVPFVYGGTATDVPGSSGSTVHTDSNTVQEQDITSQPKNDGTNGVPRVGLETRPVNLAVVRCISLGHL